MIKSKIKEYFSNKFIVMSLLKRVHRRPYLFGFDFLICYFYSSYLSYRLFGLTLLPKVYFSKNIFRVVIDISKTSRVECSSKQAIVFESYMHSNSPVVLSMGDGALLKIDGVIYLGSGCKISVGKEAALILGGELNGNRSGITSDSIIICSKKIIFGGGSIMSWGCYITDTSNHFINGEIRKDEITIGENVWISEGCTITAGTVVGNGSIVASKSFVKGVFGSNTLIAGIPAMVKRYNVAWSR